MPDSTVKIARFHKTGGPEVIVLEDMPLPEPAAGEVRLRVQAIGLNRAEVMYRKGEYLVRPHLPSKLGYEAAGIVEAVGPGVDQGLLLKKFSTVPCFNLNQYGVYGEVAIVPAYALAPYPLKLTPIEATSIWMQYLTAYGALVHYGKIAKDDFVIITAVSSSVGIAAIDIARVEGAVTIATTRQANKKKALLSLGADHVIVTDDENLPARVKEITKGKGARIIFDPIGGKRIEVLAEAASPGGIIFIYDHLAFDPTPFPLLSALHKGLSIRGYTLFEIVTMPEIRAKAEKYIFDHLKAGTFNPKIDRIFPLAEIVEAHRYMESNEKIGKVVIKV